MSNNDFYDDRFGLTFRTRTTTKEEAKAFMKEVAKQPTHPTKEFIVTDVKTRNRIFYNL